MGRIALLVDGNNLSHEYLGRRKLYPVLNIALDRLEDIGDVTLKWLYLDEADYVMASYASSLGFTEKSIGMPADRKIKDAIKEICHNRMIDTICLGSGDGDFCHDLSQIKRYNKGSIVLGLYGKISWRLCNEADHIITIYEDEIKEFDSTCIEYLDRFFSQQNG